MQVGQRLSAPAWARLAKGRPQAVQSGSVMKCRAVKQAGQKVPWVTTWAGQLGQWGGEEQVERGAN